MLLCLQSMLMYLGTDPASSCSPGRLVPIYSMARSDALLRRGMHATASAPPKARRLPAAVVGMLPSAWSKAAHIPPAAPVGTRGSCSQAAAPDHIAGSRPVVGPRTALTLPYHAKAPPPQVQPNVRSGRERS